MTDEISQILDTYHFNTLARLAEAAGLGTTGPGGKKLRKKELLAAMRAEFFTEKRVRASWERLGERERAVVNRLLLRGGSAPTKSLQRELVRAGLATEAPKQEKSSNYYYYSGVPYDRGAYEGDPARHKSRVFEDIMARLTYHGLVFSQSAASSVGGTPFKIQFHPADTLYVPQAVRQYLPEPEPIPSGLAGWQPERVQSGAPTVLLRDMYLYWDYVRKNEVSFIQSGTVAKRHLKAINQILLVPDPLLEGARSESETNRLYLLRQLLEACQLICQKRGMLRPAGGNALAVPDFWGQPQAEQLEACLKAWPHLQGTGGLPREADTYGGHHAHARKVLLAVLRTQRPGMWVEPDELLEQAQSRDPDFLFGERTRVEKYRYGYYSSYSHGYYSENTETLLKQFEQFETQFVNNCLTGFLHEIGVVELGYTGKKLAGFRITPAGAVMLDLQPTEDTEHPDEARQDTGRLIVQPNFQLLAIGPVSLALLAQLDLFAEREQADRGAFAYRLTRESVYRAQQLGLDAANVRAIIERHANTDMPQNVRRSLDEWAAHHERIVFRTGVSLLQAADLELLNTLLESPDTGEHFARAVTPEVALLKKGRQEALVTALVSQGLFPAVSGDRPESADRSVIVHEDGAIRPVHAVPSLHLRGRLARLAEENTDGAWALTPASVRLAGGGRSRVLKLLEELERLNRGEIPPQVVERIKAWGGYYGQAAAETLTLIEFDSQVTLEELRARPDLAPYLIPFPAQGRALAVVPAGKLEELRGILSQLGIEMKDGI